MDKKRVYKTAFLLSSHFTDLIQRVVDGFGIRCGV